MTGFEKIENFSAGSSSSNPFLISLQKVSKTYGERNIFSNLDINLGSHEFLTLLGSSGCGKSTLLRILGDLEPASSGQIQRKPQLQCSFVFQEPRLLPWRTVLENTLLPWELKLRSRASGEEKMAAQKKALEQLELLQLLDSKDKFPHELSGGMKMRAALARSLMLSPDLLLFDEPFSALDEETRFFLQYEIRKLFERKPFSMIFVTHSLEEALFLSDRILIFQNSTENLQEFIPSFLEIPQREPSLREELFFFEDLRALRQVIRGNREKGT